MGISFIQAVRLYVEVNLGLGLSYLVFALCFRWSAQGEGAKKSDWLRWGELILWLAVLMPVVSALIPKSPFWHPMVQMWSGVRYSTGQKFPLVQPVLTWVAKSDVTAVTLPGHGMRTAALLILASFMVGLAMLSFNLFKLWRQLTQLPVAKRIGRVVIAFTDESMVPFSSWLPGHGAFVVAPQEMMRDLPMLRLSVSHELQHHRQGDTFRIYGFELLKALFFPNPFMHAWSRLLGEIQELSCDEALTQRQSISPHAYGHCLIQAAEIAVRSRARLVGTTSLAASASGTLLQRRIQMILNQERRPRRWAASVVGIGTLCLLTTMALASRSVTQDRKISLNDALHLERSGSVIPLNINEKVVTALNEYVGTAEGRQFISNSMTRMQNYLPMIEGSLAKHGAPKELLAVPIVESGYKNYIGTPLHGAGLWGFITSTARRYGLIVNDGEDQRLDEAKETEAAMEYLTDNYRELQDWRLALKAYNEGEGRVKKLMEEYQTNDPWYLETVAEGKEHYLSRVTAVALILRNPSLMN